MIRHLYIHIPFCPKVCPYCSFYKEASNENKTRAFLDALVQELSLKADRFDLAPETVFFGGGTPSALSIAQLDYLLGKMADMLDMRALKEWTIEMNPATVSPEKAKLLRGFGVSRISMGVQSWDPALLDILGRIHSAEEALRSYEILREAGFRAINLDHIFGIPTQSADQWQQTLARSIALAPEHISAYCLTYEEDTEFMRRYQRGEFHQDEESDAVFYETSMDMLESAGYRQYEISNFAMPGQECLHNLAYWEGAEYLGLGPSAFNSANGRRWQNVADTSAYIDNIQNGVDPVSFEEPLDEPTLLKERIAFGLRTNRGIDLSLIPGREDDVERLIREGMATDDGGKLILTRRGRLLADAIAESMI